MQNSIGVALPYPNTLPAADGKYGKTVVGAIISTAEAKLGPRKAGVRLTQINMTSQRPHISVDRTLTEVHAELSDLAGRDWESFVIEFSHEVVHVLNPRMGNASYLEEGVAEVFSHYVQGELGIKVTPHNLKQYNDAVAMLGELPMDALEFAKAVRSKLGALSGFDAAVLLGHFPEVGLGLAERLCTECRTTS